MKMSVCRTYYFHYDSSTYTNELKKIITDVDLHSMLQQKTTRFTWKNKMHLFIPLFILFSTLTYFDLKNECGYVYEYFQWSHFRNKAPCMHIPKFEKCMLMDIRV